MILFHGTNIDFDRIDFSKSKHYKDFGKGFYLTDIRLQTEELARKRLSTLHSPGTIRDLSCGNLSKVTANRNGPLCTESILHL